MSRAEGRSRRGPGLIILALVVALAAILALSRPRQDPYLRPPLDPRGTGPAGLAASVDLLRNFGSKISLGGTVGDGDDVVFQAADRLSGEPEDELAAWVRRGGTLVVTDPLSDLGPGGGRFDDQTDVPLTCSLDVLSDLSRLGVAIPVTLRYRPGDSVCFATGDQAGVVVRQSGSGLIVSVSRVEPFLNRNLGDGDDAAFLLGLLGPGPGRTIRVLDPNRFVSDRQIGDGTILGALPDRGRQALLELAIAFVVWGLVRGRRLGRPVPEELPVPVPGSDLVLAVGELLARGDDVAGVAERLRRRSRRGLGIAVGLGADPNPLDLINSLTGHVSIDPAELQRALVDPVFDLQSLLHVSHQLDRLRKELHVRH